VNFLLDTGACVTCLDAKYLASLNLSDLESMASGHDVQIRSATGHPLPVEGCYVLPITIGRRTFQLPVMAITGLTEKAILGIDFFHRTGATLDMQNSVLKFEKNKANVHLAVTAALSYTLPPRSDTWIKGKLDHVGLGYIESNHFLVDAGIIDASNSIVPIHVYNSTDERMHIPKSMVVAEFHSVAQEDILPMEAFKRKKPPISKISDKKKALILNYFKNRENTHFMNQVKNLLMEYHDVVALDKYDLGYTDVVQHELHMRTNEPVHIPQFRIPDEHQDIINKYVDELLASGCIVRSASAYNSPLFCVKKHDGSLRIVQDFRSLNDACLDMKYQTKEVQECVDTIGKMKSAIFSSLDLVSGFWQVALKEGSQEQTSFSIPGRGRFHWVVTPMGLKGSPSTFQRLMDFVMMDLPNVQSYIDDVLVHSTDAHNHLTHLRQALDRIRLYNLKLNLAKCDFAKDQIDYLGHTLSKDGVRPHLDKVKAVRDYPEPQTVKAIREFHGFINYFRSHIKNFSLLAGQLTKLIRKDSTWKGGPLPIAAKVAFQQLKDQLCSAPLLAYPKKDLAYRVACDAATGDEHNPGGLGAVLSQVDKDGKEHVIAYASRSLKEFEKNYTPYLLELAACTWAVDHWSVYLAGDKPFVLLTDHRPVEKMTRLHKKTLNRLQQQMLEYNFIVQYRKGDANGAPDALSRNPVDSLRVLSPTADTVAEQKKDPLSAAILAYLEGGWLPSNSAEAKRVLHYAPHCSRGEQGELLFTLTRKNFPTNLVVWAPPNMRGDIILACHASRFAGHCSEFRTVERIRHRFFWPGMVSDVQAFINTCNTCQICKKPQIRRLRAPLTPLPIPDRPNVRVHCDLFGGNLKGSPNGNKWICVITDAFTKYSICVPIPTKDAVTVAKAILDHWVVLFSVPLQILTDRGREYSNEVMSELAVLLGFDHLMTSAFHPQTNSSSESYNRTLIKFMTQALAEGTTLDWEQQLVALQFSYNTQVHKSTLQTPFFLTFLHHPRMPFFDMEVPATRYSDSWPTEAFLRMQNAYRLAKSNNEEANRKMKEKAEKKDKLREFNVGDPVIVYYEKHVPRKHKQKGNHKFEPAGVRGFNILRRVGPAAYVVSQGPHGRPTNVNVDRIVLDKERFTGLTDLPKQHPSTNHELEQKIVKPVPHPNGNATKPKLGNPAKIQTLPPPTRMQTRSMSRASGANVSVIHHDINVKKKKKKKNKKQQHEEPRCSLWLGDTTDDLPILLPPAQPAPAPALQPMPRMTTRSMARAEAATMNNIHWAKQICRQKKDSGMFVAIYFGTSDNNIMHEPPDEEEQEEDDASAASDSDDMGFGRFDVDTPLPPSDSDEWSNAADSDEVGSGIQDIASPQTSGDSNSDALPPAQAQPLDSCISTVSFPQSTSQTADHNNDELQTAAGTGDYECILEIPDFLQDDAEFDELFRRSCEEPDRQDTRDPAEERRKNLATIAEMQRLTALAFPDLGGPQRGQPSAPIMVAPTEPTRTFVKNQKKSASTTQSSAKLRSGKILNAASKFTSIIRDTLAEVPAVLAAAADYTSGPPSPTSTTAQRDTARLPPRPAHRNQ
jgi:transposase InsO family protein